MPEGSCICGKIRIAYDGEPSKMVICHCNDCRKISGAMYGTDLLVPRDRVRVVSGEPKLYHKRADSGNVLTSRFCADCGTTLYRSCDDNIAVFNGHAIIKMGVMDCQATLNGMKPVAELFVGQRVGWMEPMKDIEQRAGMT